MFITVLPIDLNVLKIKAKLLKRMSVVRVNQTENKPNFLKTITTPTQLFFKYFFNEKKMKTKKNVVAET